MSKHLQIQRYAFCKYCLARETINLKCLQAGNQSLGLNIALGPDLGGDCDGLLEGDQGLARAREFGGSFRIRPEHDFDNTLGQILNTKNMTFTSSQTDIHREGEAQQSICPP